jgi:hypothetical protein
MIAGALLLALAAPSGITLVTPSGSGDVSLAVVEWQGGTWLNFLQFPPGPGVAEGQIDSLMEHRETRVELVLAGPRLPNRITMRRIYPETAGIRIGPVQKLAVLERTEGGYWHDQWDTEVRDGRACLSRDAIEHFHIAVPHRTPDRNGEICFDV